MQLVKPANEAEDIKERKARAKAHFDAIKEAGQLHSRTSMVIGWHAYRMKADGDFGVLGFADENEARIASGVGESTWYANIRLAEAFKELPEKRFISMKQANAKALADMPESERLSTTWIRMAETMKIEDFAAKVDDAMDGKARASDGKERSKTMKLSMPASRMAVIEEKAKEFAISHGLEPGDIGKAIEVSLIETTEGTTLVSAITNAMAQIKAAKEVIRSPLSADEALGRVGEILDEVVLAFDAALNQQQQADAA